MKKFELRPYQQEALGKIAWSKRLEGNDVISLPTGSGKSLVIAETANLFQEHILILQPTAEILEQNYKKLSQYVDESEMGIYSASFKQAEIKKYTFAMIGSIHKKPEEFQNFKTVIIDEAHDVNNKKAGSMYLKFFKAINNPKVYGFTATPYRVYPTYFRDSDGTLRQSNSTKIITRTMPKFFDRIIYSVNIGTLIDQGYLAPLEYIDESFIDQSQIPLNAAKTGFDDEKFDKLTSSKDRDVTRAILSHLQAMKRGIVFCSTISQATRLSEALNESGSISSKMTNTERKRIISDFKEGKIKILFNVGVLTTGFDLPEIDYIFLLRPTRSIGLYYQMLGRGVRLSEGKKSCKVIDFTSTVKRLGRAETISLTKDLTGKWELMTERGNWHAREMYNFAIESKDSK